MMCIGIKCKYYYMCYLGMEHPCEKHDLKKGENK